MSSVYHNKIRHLIEIMQFCASIAYAQTNQEWNRRSLLIWA